jgi:hypothetical protein
MGIVPARRPVQLDSVPGARPRLIAQHELLDLLSRGLGQFPEGITDGLAGAGRFVGGALADDPGRRRAVAVGGYTVTAVLRR